MASVDEETRVNRGSVEFVQWLVDPKALAQFSNALDFVVESEGHVLLANDDSASVLSVMVEGSAAGAARITHDPLTEFGMNPRDTACYNLQPGFSVQGEAIFYMDSARTFRRVKLHKGEDGTPTPPIPSALQTIEAIASSSWQHQTLQELGLLSVTYPPELSETEAASKRPEHIIEIVRLDPLLNAYDAVQRAHKLANAQVKKGKMHRDSPATLYSPDNFSTRYVGALNRPWMLNETELLFGPFGFQPRTAPSFNENIYGVNNRAYFNALFASWSNLHCRPNPPRALTDFFSDLKTRLQRIKQCAANEEFDPLLHPNDDSLFLRRVLLPPDLAATQEYVFSCPMEDLISHLQIVRTLTDEYVPDSSLLFQMRLERDYTVVQLIQFLAEPKSAPFDTKDCVAEIVGAICSASTDPKELRLKLAPLFRSNPGEYSRILSEIVRTRQLTRGESENKKGTTLQLQDLRHVLASQLCDWTEWVETVAFPDREPDCAILVRGVRVSTYSFWLRGAWKYFAKFWDERQLDDHQEKAPDSERTEAKKELPTLDLGSLPTVSGVIHLIQYFFTGDPQITRFLDAYTLLALAREYMLVDENGKAFPEHETLIWQIHFTLGTSMGPTTEECLDAMYIAAESKDERLWSLAFPVAKEAYSSVINSEAGQQLYRDHPYAYDMLLWAVLNDEDMKLVCVPLDSTQLRYPSPLGTSNSIIF